MQDFSERLILYRVFAGVNIMQEAVNNAVSVDLVVQVVIWRIIMSSSKILVTLDQAQLVELHLDYARNNKVTYKQVEVSERPSENGQSYQLTDENLREILQIDQVTVKEVVMDTDFGVDKIITKENLD